jgi:AcrR family transcriptional regulator
MSDTKEHIMKSSFNLFLQKSFKEVTMQEIVEKTGMSKGAFYHYFESKEQFFLEVVNHFTSTLMVDYSKLSKDSLYQFYHDYIKCMNDDTIYPFSHKENDADSNFTLNYYVLVFDAMKLFPSYRERVNTNLQSELKIWEEIVRIARDTGEINSPMTNQQIASMFIYTSDGVALHRIMKDINEDRPSTLLIVWDGLYKELIT